MQLWGDQDIGTSLKGNFKWEKEKRRTKRENYKIQRNFCKKLLRKTKELYFDSLNTNKIMDNGNSIMLLWRDQDIETSF